MFRVEWENLLQSTSERGCSATVVHMPDEEKAQGRETG
jgi:hypothetical protein